MTTDRGPLALFGGLLLLASACGARAAAPVQPLAIRPAATLIVQSADSAPAAFIVYNPGPDARSETVRLTCDGATVAPDSFALDLQPKQWRVISARVALDLSADRGDLKCSAGEHSVAIAIARGIDLTALPWKRAFSARAAPPDPARASPATDDCRWPEIRVPAQWNENDYAWCRVRVAIPERWRGRKLRLIMGAVDDNDITYLNGREIGRTNGWDRRRDYLLPSAAVKWGTENLLTVMVENPWAGGGLYKPPFILLVGDAPAPTAQITAGPRPEGPRPPYERPTPGAVGRPRPLRPFHVKQGILRYPDGAEVALWGVNYYPQSWYQFENMRKLGVDMKAAIRTDLDHLQRMGVEAIRIHVFDREISDGAGNLHPNIHLDLLDYLVAQCSARGIYMFFTPIAWWGGPNERPGAFSAETSKPGMMFVPVAKAAAANYLRQFLTHVNRYSRCAYKDESCLCLLEVQNEPAYFLYGDLTGVGYAPQGERPQVLERDRVTFRALWQQWLAAHGADDLPAYFPLFRYELMRDYITTMIAAIRSTGAEQPVAISHFGANGDDITAAIADSECDAITISAYPGGWERVNDGINLLPEMGPMALDARLAAKARLAYEFDTPATNTSCYLFPAIAAAFRSAEVQVACQFQYDSSATARWNTDWWGHWLNWLYTPSKTVSYMIGGETFRRLPRGVRYQPPQTELILGPMATSFTRNLSLLATPELVMHARSVGAWNPLRWPTEPRRIVAVGNSPYADYGGTGLYVLARTGKDEWRLTVNPDQRLVGNCLHGTFDSPLAELEENYQWFRLKLPGWGDARCYRLRGDGEKMAAVPSVEGGWLLRPGAYVIRRQAGT
jgi:hypothetical protein